MAGQTQDAAPPIRHGAWLHASLAVSDMDAALGFFTGHMGFALAFRADDLTDEVAWLTARPGLRVQLAQLTRPDDGCRLELIAFHDGAPVPAAGDGPVPRAHLAFAVADIDAEIARLCAAGARPMGEIVAFPEGRCAYLIAPGGVAIELEEVAAGA